MYTSFTDWDFGPAHHGIKGQKWGERRYQNSDGTLTALGRKHYGVGEGGSRKLSGQFNRQLRKLNRLYSRTDVNKQTAISEKYGKRAKIGAGITAGLAAATAASHLGTISRNKADYLKYLGNANRAEEAAKKSLDAMFNPGASSAVKSRASSAYQGYVNSMTDNARKYGSLTNQRSFGTAKASTSTKILAGATVAAAGYTAYSAIRSKVAKARTTDAGHAKAVAKYEAQYSKMINQFGNTPYAELLKKQQS